MWELLATYTVSILYRRYKRWFSWANRLHSIAFVLINNYD